MKSVFINPSTTKRKSRKNLHPLLDRGENIVTEEDEEQTEVLEAFFASVFNRKIGGHQGVSLNSLTRDGEQNRPCNPGGSSQWPAVPSDTHKSIRPYGIHPWVLRELAEEFAKMLSIIHHQSCLTGEIHRGWSLWFPCTGRAGRKVCETPGLLTWP